jgi:hypothetical protein
MIKPEDKRPDKKIEALLPAAYVDRVAQHAKDLNSPEAYVFRAIVMDYFDSGYDQADTNTGRQKTARSARKKEAKPKAVPLPRQPTAEVA